MNGTEMSRDWNSVVGLKVVLRTTHDHRHHNSRGRDANSARSNTVEGEIFCYDPQLQLLALYESGGQHASSRRKTFRLLNTNTIAEVVSIVDPSNDARQQSALSSVPYKDIHTPLPPVNMQKLREREKMAIYERKKQLGSGVTSDAQFIFDQLSKTLSCKWHNDVIVVMDEVHIHPPYTLNDVRAEDEHKRNHIKRILEGVLQKLAKHVQ